jgi:hypothetical protein
LSKSNSQTAHFHLLFHTFFFPAKSRTHQFLLVYDTLYVGDYRKPEKVAYPQVPHTTPVMCDGKAAFSGAPLRCVSQEKGSPNLTKAGPLYKSSYINKGRKSKKAHSETKIPLVLIESMTATNIEQIDLT